MAQARWVQWAWLITMIVMVGWLVGFNRWTRRLTHETIVLQDETLAIQQDTIMARASVIPQQPEMLVRLPSTWRWNEDAGCTQEG